jgi:hypothetical protein
MRKKLNNLLRKNRQEKQNEKKSKETITAAMILKFKINQFQRMSLKQKRNLLRMARRNQALKVRLQLLLNQWRRK